MKSRILVTGAAGFVGSRLTEQLIDAGYKVNAAVRNLKNGSRIHQNAAQFEVGSIDGDTNWQEALAGCQVVVHLAARVHKMADHSSDPRSQYQETNTAGTAKLARDAARTGVNRFIYLSTIKVYGESIPASLISPSAEVTKRQYQEDRPLAPIDPYGISKAAAEKELRDVCCDNAMEYVTIRPPLVYGPGVKANFLRLLKLAKSSLPLPVGAIKNQRSLVALDNLTALIVCCLEHPGAANQAFNVTDCEDVSTPELLRHISAALGRSCRVFNVPVRLLRLAAQLTGQQETFRRLDDDLVIETHKAKELLDWQPPTTLDAELAKTAKWFLGQKR